MLFTMKSVVVLSLFLRMTAALAVIDSTLASSCIYYLKQYDWGCGGTDQSHAEYRCRCQNINWVGSVTNCIVTHATSNGDLRHALRHLSSRCIQKAHLHYSIGQLEECLQNATLFMQEAPADLATRVHLPISVNETVLIPYQKSFEDIGHHVTKGQWLGWGLVWYWGAYMAYLTAANFLWRQFRVAVFPRTARQWIQKHGQEPAWTLGLLVGDVVLVTGFVMQTALSTAVSYTVTLPNMYINDRYLLTLDLLGNRSAMLSLALMPVVYLFGLRNNPFCRITGLSQAAFITYHKVVAIVMSVEILVHSIAWTAYAIRSEGYGVWSTDAYWRWGVVGTILLFLMLGQSAACVRNAFYELFLVAHKTMGWVFIAAMWFHCFWLGWMDWVHVTIAFIAYDRMMRCFKTFVVNSGWRQIQIYIVDDKIVKVTVPKLQLHDVFYKPGSHVFISFYHWPIWHRCFQSHPFTIISSPIESADEFAIYIRIKKGTTAAIGKLKSDGEGSVRMWLLVEGPYGNGVLTLRRTEQLVGVAGGLGICALLPIFHHNPKGSLLYWTVNNSADIAYLRPDLEHLLSEDCDVHVYLTKCKEDGNRSFEKKYPYVTILGTRPEVREWVLEGIKRGIAKLKTDIFVLSCGPGLMDRDVQRSVRENTRVGLQHSVHFYRENYLW